MSPVLSRATSLWSPSTLNWWAWQCGKHRSGFRMGVLDGCTRGRKTPLDLEASCCSLDPCRKLTCLGDTKLWGEDCLNECYVPALLLAHPSRLTLLILGAKQRDHMQHLCSVRCRVTLWWHSSQLRVLGCGMCPCSSTRICSGVCCWLLRQQETEDKSPCMEGQWVERLRSQKSRT